MRKVKRCLNHLCSSYFKLHVRWLRLLGTLSWTSPRWGRCKQRSNLPLADLSVTRITYLSKLIGMK
ncbi:hypothetical protein BV921_20005 [Pectobacterium odoriferum]|nr:hypothetical protein BV921_20005 [Pectobacterium odoriferum]